ncbi:hypothetical protein RHSIM_Rhsim12G0203200 [Rhododendron simsii]|uniref:Sulfotransferase n=1 Tax=Rhododendron simsii TaxID=118357 RepID=A0A834G2V6_RHOSS|nr:hypothetical protein RHSIM_Rhsim12G0203200 [Rhododendron simsii]
MESSSNTESCDMSETTCNGKVDLEEAHPPTRKGTVSIIPRGVKLAQEQFEPQSIDIILCSTPKSGTTWLKALAFAIVTRTGFDFSANPLLVKVPHDCVPMWRDPKDVFVSFWHSICKVRPEIGFLPMEVVFELFCQGVSFYGPYWDHVLGYWKASLEQPEKVNKKGSHWVDMPVAIENNTYFRRGRVGDWKNHLAEEMVQRMDRITEQKLGSWGLMFRVELEA